ncbi:uncharacterized protein METZ01_LOCUS260202, partial [marine metagenome]
NDGSMESHEEVEQYSFSGSVSTTYDSYPSSYSKTNIGGSGSKLPTKLEIWADVADQGWGSYCTWFYVYLTDSSGANITYKSWAAPRPRNTNLYTQFDLSQFDNESWYRPYAGFKVRMYAPYSGCAAYLYSMTVKLTYNEVNLPSFNTPTGMTGDIYGNLYISGYGSHKIRKIDSEGHVTTYAGSGTAGSTNGASTTARFNSPYGLASDSSGNIYVADSGNNLIRKIDSNGTVTTLAGSGSAASTDGQGTSASFNRPLGIAVDNSGNVYVVDNQGHKIRRIDSSGYVTTLAGTGSAGSSNQGASSTFNSPSGLALDSSNNLYVADLHNHLIRKISIPPEHSEVALTLYNLD